MLVHGRSVVPANKPGYDDRAGDKTAAHRTLIEEEVREMATSIRALGIVAAAVTGFALTTGEVSAQPNFSGASSGFAQRNLNSIRNRNSASFFSIDSINRQLLSNSVPRIGIAGINRRQYLGSLGSNSSRPNKPFKSINRGPAVSPYLALDNSINTANDYYNIVRPRQEGRRQAIQLQRQQAATQRRVNELAALSPYNPQGDQETAPTGHAAAFQSLGAYLTTGSYYPPPSSPKGR